jgi:hypothetical protein
MDYFTIPAICVILLVGAALIYGIMRIKESPFYPVHNDEDDERFDLEADMPIEGQRAALSVSSEDDRPAGPNDKVRIVAQSPDAAQYECGHDGPSWYYLSVFGDTPTKIISRKWCPDCFVKLVQEYTTRCACCGLPIRPEDGVTFYHASNPRIVHRDTYQVDDFYIGCMRDDCREPTKFLMGHWAGHEFRPVFSMDQDVDWTTQIHKAVGNA